MHPERDVELANLENGETTPWNSDANEKMPRAVGEPDREHEEVEQMNQAHLDDLERQHVCDLLSQSPVS